MTCDLYFSPAVPRYSKSGMEFATLLTVRSKNDGTLHGDYTELTAGKKASLVFELKIRFVYNPATFL